MIKGILLEAGSGWIILGALVCMFGLPMLISLIVGSTNGKKGEGKFIFWAFVILIVVIVFATLKECGGFDMPSGTYRHT